ncbi:hypothetical protein TNCV_3848071 [Trichonephila clavipes]|uniref:Uncharacterized protein n=1 Tax=Trichonephila clavipes TaxID=2585209 RepID=A0A8X6RCX0_TRICX|nr:hypothetical protein TNCV_3848071 [Trichonephila clavipes]
MGKERMVCGKKTMINTTAPLQNFLSVKTSRNTLSVKEEHVVDTYDALLVRVLGVADNGGAGLEPRVAAILVDEAIITAHHLALVDHWKRRRDFWDRIRHFFGLVIPPFLQKLNLQRVPKLFSLIDPLSCFSVSDRPLLT